MLPMAVPGRRGIALPRGGDNRVKPAPFAYHAPTSIEEACSMLASLEDAKVLAGGQSLVPLLNFRLARPGHLIDINRIPNLNRIYEQDGGVVVQARARQAAGEDSKQAGEGCAGAPGWLFAGWLRPRCWRIQRRRLEGCSPAATSRRRQSFGFTSSRS